MAFVRKQVKAGKMVMAEASDNEVAWPANSLPFLSALVALKQ